MTIGHVTSLTGSSALLTIDPSFDPSADLSSRLSIGRLIGITVGDSRVIGVINSMAEPFGDNGVHRTANIDFVGEIQSNGSGEMKFQRGVTNYPTIGDQALTIISEDLQAIHQITDSETIKVGTLQQDSAVPAYVNFKDMLTKHFAVLGTTGVGKSCAVALLLQQILAKGKDLRIFLIDPHNEYGDCFGDQTELINPKNVKLPFWLFSFEEIVDVFFKGRPGVEEEVEILSEVIPVAKANFGNGRKYGNNGRLRKSADDGIGFTTDSPVPFRISDVLALIDERMGKLENRSAWAKFHRLKSRIETVAKDPRYAFMFDNITIEDTMADVLGQLFRVPVNGRPITVMQLAGFPSEVVDSVVSVLCRMAFDFGLWSEGAAPLLVVCEEAHRYVPADKKLGFGPTRRSISRIAKEGRKYGVFLAVVSQRPGELDATILSQCSTVFAMRMANEADQMIVSSAVSDAASSLLEFLPSLGTREVVTFGEGVALPTRFSFSQLAPDRLPNSSSTFATMLDSSGIMDPSFINQVVDRWRNSAMRTKRTDSLISAAQDAGMDVEEESMEGALPVLRPPLESGQLGPVAPLPNEIGPNKGFAKRPPAMEAPRATPSTMNAPQIPLPPEPAPAAPTNGRDSVPPPSLPQQQRGGRLEVDWDKLRKIATTR